METGKQVNISAIQSLVSEFFKKKEFCDVTIRIGNEIFESHRLLLAAVSEYFYVMFNGDLSEKRKEKDDPIVLYDIDVDAFKTLLQFVYSGELKVMDSNCFALLRASDFFLLRIPMVEQQCIDYIQIRAQKAAPLSEVFALFRFACLREKTRLIDCVSLHIHKNLRFYLKDETFLEISREHLEVLLKFKKSDSNDDSLLFTLILQWVYHSHKERRECLNALMQNIDFTKVSSKYIPFIVNGYENLVNCILSNTNEKRKFSVENGTFSDAFEDLHENLTPLRVQDEAVQPTVNVSSEKKKNRSSFYCMPNGITVALSTADANNTC